MERKGGGGEGGIYPRKEEEGSSRGKRVLGRQVRQGEGGAIEGLRAGWRR